MKWLGDGVMFQFPDPGQGVLAALQMVEGLAMEGLPPAHVGMHAGPVVLQEGDCFGRTVNIATRIAEYARPGEVLVSQEVVDAGQGTPVMFGENPEFRTWSVTARPDGFPDQIVWRLGPDRDEMVADTLKGEGDIVFSPPPARIAELARSHAGQLHLSPRANTFYMG